MSATAQRVLKIVNEKRLHARASAKLVEVVEGFDPTAAARTASHRAPMSMSFWQLM